VSHDPRPWPALLRLIGRWLYAGAYGWATVAGLHVVFPGRGDAELVAWWAVALGAMAALGGAVAFVATIADRWTVEWPAVWIVAGAFACYGAIDTIRLVFGHGADLGGVATLAVATALLTRRGVELWQFSTATRGQARRARRWREVPE
jgi:hypothetical protein